MLPGKRQTMLFDHCVSVMLQHGSVSWFRWFSTGLREIEFWDVLELSLKPSISVTVWCIVLILSPPKCVLVAGEVCLKIEFKRDNSFRPIHVDMYVAINRIIWKNLNTLYVLHFYVYLLTFYVFTFRVYLRLKICRLFLFQAYYIICVPFEKGNCTCI